MSVDTQHTGPGLWRLAVVIALAVVIIDQAVKVWVKTSFWLGESVYVTQWFQLLFIENNGMAFGVELGSKLLLTLFRILVVGALIWYIHALLQRGGKSGVPVKRGYVVCLALIVAGAAGNIFDCMFYGVLFDNPMPPTVATFLPEGGGYAPLFHGKVVDMLYFPLFAFDWPAWMPIVGGQHFIFFQPVFNIADAAITVGMLVMLIFYSGQMTAPAAKPLSDDPA